MTTAKLRFKDLDFSSPTKEFETANCLIEDAIYCSPEPLTLYTLKTPKEILQHLRAANAKALKREGNLITGSLLGVPWCLRILDANTFRPPSDAIECFMESFASIYKLFHSERPEEN